MAIGNRIKEARKEKGLTQKALADSIGMAQATLSQLETGSSAGSTLLASIATKLGVRALWLETGKGPRKEEQTIIDYEETALSHTQEKGLAVREESRVTYNATPSVSLMYVTAREIALLTAFRECTDQGQRLIEKTSASAERDAERVKTLRAISGT